MTGKLGRERAPGGGVGLLVHRLETIRDQPLREIRLRQNRVEALPVEVEQRDVPPRRRQGIDRRGGEGGRER